MKKTLATLFLLTCLGSSSAYADNALILQTDFSLKDGAVIGDERGRIRC